MKENRHVHKVQRAPGTACPQNEGGTTLQHHIDTGLFRLKDAITTRTVHPATVESLMRAGVISKSLDGSCRLV